MGYVLTMKKHIINIHKEDKDLYEYVIKELKLKGKITFGVCVLKNMRYISLPNMLGVYVEEGVDYQKFISMTCTLYWTKKEQKMGGFNRKPYPHEK